MSGTRTTAVSAKTAKPARRRTASRKAQSAVSTLDHTTIAERAYYIHLEEGGVDELANWLRAERELISV
jgi:hypothetical protein